ncbi:hypothetical protein DSAG12_01646 [Promethearchaeum syntrophicum]|uniref:B box-type domain-containing protein n=1 Tax=Promethearchaeum syntrophicum TaxID=2594042 RepID=A0A5B9D9F7_9ARCH|nr:hypothetical protein [Candidatus Prometheoarchaeum syntrophicum]QEE15819.1 hypothetical protein DSAG12_01646 [Candidatus Prometheoarchaeum syntrophicum]
MTRYFEYACQRCGNGTAHQLFVLQCQNCGKSLCKKCAKGSLCLDCYNALPDDLQKNYNRQLKTPIIIISVILLAIFIPLGIIIPELLIFCAILGGAAWLMDHGRLKTTPRSAVRKAKVIVADARQRFQNIGPTHQNYQQQQQQQQQYQNQQQPQKNNQQKTYQKDPDDKYGGTFWDQ